MALIGSLNITHHILRLGGGNGSKVVLEDGGDIWLIEPDAADPVQIHKIVLEQLARQGYRIVEIGRLYTTLQLENDKATPDAGPTAAFNMQRVDVTPALADADTQFLASYGLLGLSADQVHHTMTLLRSGQKIHLIKWLREVQPGLGLKEAKELADCLMEAQGVPSSNSGCGAAMLVPLAIGAIGAAMRTFF